MNFLLRNSQAVTYDLPEAAHIAQKDPIFSEPTNFWPGALAWPGGSQYGAGEDVRILATSAKMRTRMAIEGHVDVPPGEGSILVPFKALSEDCYSAPSVASLLSMDRPFIFPGERFHIVVHVSVHHPETTCPVTPYKVAAAIQNLSHAADFGCSSNQDSMESFHDTDEGNSRKIKTPSSARNALKGKWFNTTGGGNLVATTEWVEVGNSGLLSESRKRRTEMLLESFKSSHFHVKIGRKGHRISVPQVVESEPLGLLHEEGSDGEKTAAALGCRTVLTEDGEFESTRAGGVARAATSCWSLGNGDVVVLLQVTMASEIPFRNAEVEVLQFEPYVVPSVYSEDNNSLQLSKNRTEYLLQWLLPLDRPSSPPPPSVATLPQPTLLPSPSGRLSFSGTGNSNFFSFSHVRNSSVGSTPTSVPTPVVLCTPPPTPSYGPEEWGRFSSEIGSHGDVGSEGLLSFRGTALEPQRFSAHCGLPGPYVPGKRWKRTLAIVQPVRLESYFTDCNTQDLICVLIENILPPAEDTADVVIFIDSVSIVCQSASPGSSPLPVPVACVEVGEDHTLPNLALRPGEQHSLILRPISQVWKHSVVGDTGSQNELFQDVQKPGRFGMRTFDDQELDSSVYAILVSCHCTHTESRLHFKHSLSWYPRPLRDLLLSVALENSSPVKLPNEASPQLTPQVVSVQATNLTSQDMYLTLLAPSSLATSPFSVMSFPTNGTVVNMVNKSYQSLTPRKVLAWEDLLTKPIADMSSGRLSLPPVQPMEMVLGVKPTVLKERIFPASSALLDNVAARTHLWLQSTVPLGRLPPHATIAVRCSLLPLTSGIITLDTVHVATHEHDAVYMPENSLQIYCMSSVASDITESKI